MGGKVSDHEDGFCRMNVDASELTRRFFSTWSAVAEGTMTDII